MACDEPDRNGDGDQADGQAAEEKRRVVIHCPAGGAIPSASVLHPTRELVLSSGTARMLPRLLTSERSIQLQLGRRGLERRDGWCRRQEDAA
jgi:hypothetical protein